MNTEAIERPTMVREARSISEFCEAWGISIPTFYRHQEDGLMPEVFKIGRRRLITMEAEQAWKQRRQGKS